MLTTLGYAAPEMTDEPPGHLSPARSLMFANILMDLAVVSKASARGLVQMLACPGYCERAGPASYATCASESELQNPVGFWDLLAFAAAGDLVALLPATCWRPCAAAAWG